MRHARLDYESIQPFPQKRPHIVKIDGKTKDVGDDISSLGKHMDPIIPEDEPVFLIRAMDAAGPVTVRFWADETARRGGDPDLVARVRRWADEMSLHALRADTGPKVADTPPGVLRP